MPKVRLVDENGEQLGVVNTKEALERAMDAGLDLVEVSPNAEPPVCKILDYGKFKYQAQKKAADARKKQVKVTVKEITLRPGTEENDYQIKLRKMKEFLEKGDKVKATIRFRGRELGNKEAGVEMLKRIGHDLVEYGKMDVQPKAEGRQMHILLSPLAPKKV